MIKSCLKQVKPSRLAMGISAGNSPILVSFGRIEIREYPYDLGDNPSVSAGVPVTLGWDYTDEYDFEVENYERIFKSCNREGSYCPKLSVSRRAQILLGSGYSMIDIVECTMEVLDVQERRADSVRNRKWDGFHKLVEITKRKFKKPSRRRGSIQETVSIYSSQSHGASISPPLATSISMIASGSQGVKAFRRRSSSTATHAPKLHDLGDQVLQNEVEKQKGIFRRRGRRRGSLNFTPEPNFTCALPA